MIRSFGLVLVVSLVLAGCGGGENKGVPLAERQVDDRLLLNFSLQPAEIGTICGDETRKLQESLGQVAAVAEADATFANTALALERATTDYMNVLNGVTFLKYVSDREEVRAAADECETAISQLFVDIYTREDLFRAIRAAAARGEALDPESDQLLKDAVLSFRRNGLELSPADKASFIDKKKQLVKLEAEFSTNLNEYQDELLLEASELEGLPDSYVRGLARTPEGKYRVTLAYPHYYPFMENAKNADARKRLEYKFSRRGGERNKELLTQAIVLRQELAALLGYSSHAAFVLDQRMAKRPENVTENFLTPLVEKLQPKGLENLREMAAAKQKETGDLSAATIEPWDWRYYDNVLRREKHQFDSSKVREYFPLDVVLKGMFEVYQGLLGVTFVPVEGGPSWNSAVSLYRIVEGDKTLAYFYMDLFPRPGKYGHAAAFTLVSGHTQADGRYRAPVSSIVANFNPPLPGEPSLLDHGEVETLFHEFGHIMHQTLTTATYASFSGTSVRRDFVEAPSQMLEAWVWEPSVLPKLSGHYQDKSQPLPEDLIRKMVGAKLHNAGIRYLRQAAFATLDMEYHTLGAADTTEVYGRAMREVMLIPIQEDTFPEASFGHLMGGYDAGYYGYLWSEVYAADMYTRFEQEGQLNGETGRDYRKFILAPGGTQDPFQLISQFLKRAPNQDAFLRSLGL